MPIRTARLLPLCLGFTAALTAAALARAPERPPQLDRAAPAHVQLAPPVRASLCSAITPTPQPAANPVLFRDRPGARLPLPSCGASGPVQRT